MRNLLTSAALLMTTAGIASAGPTSYQSFDILFQSGTYAEMSFVLVNPSVSGTDPLTDPTGSLAPSYLGISGGFKLDASDKISVALIFDQPYGSAADYPVVGSVYDGSTADISRNAITLLTSYDVTDKIVAFGGPTYMVASASASLPFVGAGYTVVGETAGGLGFTAGVAYQIPRIALRVSLSYKSAITTSHVTTETGLVDVNDDNTVITTPQSARLDFRTGVNPKTLVFGSIEWVDWSSYDISPPDYTDVAGPLVSREFDSVTYSLGVGRKLSEVLSAGVSIGYEAARGGDPSPLRPTDGMVSLGGGLTYTLGAAKITAGIRHAWLGDADGPAGTFTGNSATGYALKIGYNF